MNELERYFRMCLDAEYTEGEDGVSWCMRQQGEELYILFQHSRGIVDWFNNVRFHAVPYRGMNPIWQCHEGFVKVWGSARPTIGTGLARALRQGAKRVTVIGYSHGAALAVLCYEWIWYHVPSLRTRLTGFGYGCPRVIYGCLPPALALRWENFYVIRNEEDLVTHLPPKSFGYCHVGNLVTLEGNPALSPIDAHRPENYLSALQKLE